jgi:hypothetical protein
LVNGDTLTGLLATAATIASNVGAYSITQGTLAASSNYTLTYIGANLTVTAAPLTVTADAQSRAYGAANPPLSYVSAGLVNGDALSGFLATTATTASNVGAYAITQGTLAASSNYTLTYVGANLTVTASPIPVDNMPAGTLLAQPEAFPSYFSLNDIGGTDFAPENFAPDSDKSTCTPAGVVRSFNQKGRVSLTGELATSCKRSLLHIR